MKVYVVSEFITETFEETASGIFSTKEKAKEGILERVAQDYTPEEMEKFHFTKDDEYVTEENDWVVSVTYTIDEIEVDKEIM